MKLKLKLKLKLKSKSKLELKLKISHSIFYFLQLSSVNLEKIDLLVVEKVVKLLLFAHSFFYTLPYIEMKLG